MRKLKNIHPGEILKEEFLLPLNITAYKLCKDIDIPQTRISEILKGKRSISADTALRLSKYFGNTPNFWLGLQNDFDIEEELQIKGDQIKMIKKLKILIIKKLRNKFNQTDNPFHPLCLLELPFNSLNNKKFNNSNCRIIFFKNLKINKI